MTETGFEPKIVAFVCNWCSYVGADIAGSMKLKYTPNVNLIRVMCSGRVDPEFIMEAFRGGADGVMVLGCHPGDCHYIEGNYNTLKRYSMLKPLLDQFNIEQDRLYLDWVSASEGEKFARVMDEMNDRITQLGPLNWDKVIDTRQGGEV
ncbi:MAG: hydrogenase iron-sulfur subunit [Candidatus Aminicenantes bacterium]|nr:hydrogenase iron-sulfur subunit [Candidatus Aminicenantes bacterium]NOR52517.1 hydrogenase iron-sulfur subunit [Candidatus Aminicenantes bacterium]